MKLPYEATLALRYLRPRRTFVSVITLISIVGVLLGVAVLIIVIAVMSGFDKEWRDRILGFKAHITVYAPDPNEPLLDYERVMKALAKNPNVVGVSPFMHSQVLVRTEPTVGKSRPSAPLLMGYDAANLASVSVLPNSIIEGKFDFEDHGLVVGCDYARSMHISLNDRVAVYSYRALEAMADAAGKTNAQTAALAEDYIVRGIFDVGFPDYNMSIVAVSLDDARDLLSLPEDSVNAIEIKLRDPFLAEKVVMDFQKSVSPDLTYVTWTQDNPEIFNALATEKKMMFFLLFFIMIVAAFGIVNCQITFVVQKTREIGILKSLGATSRQVMWIFLSQSVIVGVLGVGLGFAGGLTALHYRNQFLQFMEKVTHTNLLPSSIYHVYDLPAVIQPMDVVVICGTAFAACVLAGVFPAWKASRLQPVEALRYD
jgi:lipoprotein-releasing system permease protein